MEIFPKKAVEQAKQNLDIKLNVVDGHRQLGDLRPSIINTVEAAAIISYPIAIAANSLMVHLSKMRSEQPAE